MKVYLFNNKVYDYKKLVINVLPKLLKLLDYIKNSNQEYFSKDELMKIMEG